ncbi:MAG: hypothetical protein GX452_13775 [Ignavibacteriales bacterium]|nr:hypothetical protein [Ignavibacteriales bacterium]
MTIEEYKQLNSRIKHLVFPSGLEIDIELPKPIDFLESGILDAKKGTEMLKMFLALIKLPDGLTINDLNFTDFIFFQNYLKDFFASGESLPGS